MIAYILGWIMKLEGLFMLIPVLVALIYREHNGVWFAIVAVCALVFGAVVTHKKPESNVFYMREGCIATAMSWFIMSVIGCLPFFLSGEIPSFTDALFETVSGFTTTGSTILSDVESLSYCMLFWRSFTHWIGGMGVLVFLLAVIQMTGGSNNEPAACRKSGTSGRKTGAKNDAYSKNFICDLPWNDSDSFCVTGVWENVGI